MARHDHPWKGALRVAAIYLIIAIFWIVFSDRAVQLLIEDPQAQAWVQTVKGTAFVLASAFVIFTLVFRELKGRRRVEGRYRILVDHSFAGIYVIRNNRFLFVNPQLADIFGYSEKDMLTSVRVGDLVDPEDRDLVRENLRRRETRTVEALQYRFTGRRANGERIRVEAHGRRLDWDGEQAVMGLLLDVTERERMDERLRSTQRLEALGRVTGAVVHDFNNFLTAIMAPIELCADEMDHDDPNRAELVEAMQSAKRAVGLTRKLLAFSRGKPYRPRTIDLAELVRRLEPLLERLCSGPLVLALDLPGGQPAVQVDPDGFEQVLVNLVVNACEARADRVTVRVATAPALAANGAGPGVFLEVEDDGEGMDEATRRRAVEPFFSTKEKGTGLGLATVHGIVLQAKGELTVESAPHAGTTFRIRLPGVDGEVEPLELPPATDAGGRVRIEGVTALVVDDDEAVRRVLVRILRRHGLATLEAGSGSEALAVAHENGGAIGLVVTDLGLPDLDGVELVSRLEKVIDEPAVVYVSGQSTEEVLERLSRDRRRPIVEKPFTVKGLMEEVAGALGNPRGTGRVGV